jgi:hypothetical protein
LLDGFFESYSDFFQWVRPTAGAVGYVKFSGPMSSSELGKALADAGISIKPAYVFSDPAHADAYAIIFVLALAWRSCPRHWRPCNGLSRNTRSVGEWQNGLPAE